MTLLGAGSRSRALVNRALDFVLRKIAPEFWAKMTYEHIVRSVNDPKNWKPVDLTVVTRCRACGDVRERDVMAWDAECSYPGPFCRKCNSTEDTLERVRPTEAS